MSSLVDVVDPKQTEHEKLDRFQKLVGGNTGASQGPAVPVKTLLSVLKDRTDNTHALLHGPLYDVRGVDKKSPEFKAARVAAFEKLLDAQRNGQLHRLWMQCQREAAAKDPALAADPLGINIVMTRLIASDTELPYLQNSVILSNVADCERIARAHVKKQPNFTPILFQSLIATTDNAHWQRQRHYLTQSFMPQGSLAKIFPTSLSRAKHCAARLGELAAQAGPHGVQMHDFFLHEAQAQLQMALFGMDEAFMESTNKKIRDVFNGTSDDPEYGKKMCLDMMEQVKSNPRFAGASEPAVLAGEKPVFGPLSKAIHQASTELDMNLTDRFGNMMLVLFAGHDTTAHTMTWLTYELARHPQYQRRVQAEVDALFSSLNGRDMQYEDCQKLPFLTKCVMETLRLWTAVPNGTFRELQHDDHVMGPGGKPVTLPKGTYVQIFNWMRQRNPVLWGADADEFNPDREFKENEVWGLHGGSFHASNPASDRFSPFTFPPRDCLGKNFAQMEMRTIIANLLHRWSFVLSEPYTDANVQANGPIENAGATMGPRDLTPEGLAERQRRIRENRQPRQPMAMYLRPVPRAGAKL